ncbi:WxL protein host-binding domain-containing protein [Lacticaseibacillus saniviri]|uniref:Cell surface protein n=1 Tax=Lacticaseibacillus saniviri JCM 17471 = DSM 24301 TaxID=1293598 RepID=A0A0R2MTQ8_9LACO|nr:DUF3324 domain-containing protein [Lacticaseibacillus saniviri]KRO16887.1 cell surface protein [Lacticaseibacillus saniviri JCM 17471 = DSM 24301]MCG4281069.1 DUF916 and DUF3324 domain-containing protein [Lacticaseibacillus saniviri]
MKHKLVWAAAAAFALAVFGPHQTVSADIDNLAVTPVVANTDVTDRFEIVGQPNSNRQLKLSLSNFSSAPMSLTITPTNATVTSTGDIGYSQIVKKAHYGLPYVLNQKVKTQTIKLGGNDSQTLTFNVPLPAKSFDGLVMGGFHVSLNGSPEQFVDVPLLMTMTNQVPTPKFIFSQIKGNSYNKQTYLQVDIANLKAVALKNVSYNITVKSDDWLSKIGIGKQRYQAIKSGVSVAPNAALPIPINLHDQPVKAGKYQISGTVQVNGQRWHIATDGTVSAESAKTANAQDPNLIHDYTIYFILGIAALVILIIVISIIMFGRNKHKKKTAATKKKAKSAAKKQESSTETEQGKPDKQDSKQNEKD